MGRNDLLLHQALNVLVHVDPLTAIDRFKPYGAVKAVNDLSLVASPLTHNGESQ